MSGIQPVAYRAGFRLLLWLQQRCDGPVLPRAPVGFDGTIERVDIHLGPSGLDPDEERKLHAQFRAGKEY